MVQFVIFCWGLFAAFTTAAAAQLDPELVNDATYRAGDVILRPDISGTGECFREVC